MSHLQQKTNIALCLFEKKVDKLASLKGWLKSVMVTLQRQLRQWIRYKQFWEWTLDKNSWLYCRHHRRISCNKGEGLITILTPDKLCLAFFPTFKQKHPPKENVHTKWVSFHTSKWSRRRSTSTARRAAATNTAQSHQAIRLRNLCEKASSACSRTLGHCIVHPTARWTRYVAARCQAQKYGAPNWGTYYTGHIVLCFQARAGKMPADSPEQQDTQHRSTKANIQPARTSG